MQEAFQKGFWRFFLNVYIQEMDVNFVAELFVFYYKKKPGLTLKLIKIRPGFKIGGASLDLFKSYTILMAFSFHIFIVSFL
jgi:hypothetical protein